MPILSVNGVDPQIPESTWVAENATITGDVVMGEECSVWFQVVIRGDVNKIKIGNRVNIQDASIIHGTTGRGDTLIGNNVSIGHRAIVHGCQIHDDVLIGMGAILLDEAIIESNVIVAAGAVVTSGSVLKSGFLYAGIPAKQIKPLEEGKTDFYIKGTAAAYVEYANFYK
ncbi:MAG: gamma carbonic anhydrase family protein [Saprospiraceae bacterium]|nr:gamma carbonic anhydrase family protein [Saprospiraceae bacterium]